jgi:hypothetical protein
MPIWREKLHMHGFPHKADDISHFAGIQMYGRLSGFADDDG